MSSQWEYKNFIYQFAPPGQGMGARIGRGGYSVAGAKLEFWQNYQREIFSELQKYLDAGWQPVGEIGSSCIEIKTSYSHRDKTCAYWLFMLFFSIPTFGLVFLFALLARSEIVEPIRFVLQMRRLTGESYHPVSVPSVPKIIAQLAKLRDDGAITPEEFESKKTELLARWLS